MKVYRVTYTYMGDKMCDGTYDDREDARMRASHLNESGFQNIHIAPQKHTHNKYCGHKS